jgi:hypothetical protein
MPTQASQYAKILEFDKIKDQLKSWMRFVIIRWLKTGAVILLRSF